MDQQIPASIRVRALGTLLSEARAWGLEGVQERLAVLESRMEEQQDWFPRSA